DYQKDPEAALRALVRAAKRRVFVSIPKRWHILTPQRYLRYTLFRCYIRFYSRSEVEQLAAKMKPKKTTIFDIGREYNLVLDCEWGSGLTAHGAYGAAGGRWGRPLPREPALF